MPKAVVDYEDASRGSRALVIGLSVAVCLLAAWVGLSNTISSRTAIFAGAASPVEQRATTAEAAEPAEAPMAAMLAEPEPEGTQTAKPEAAQSASEAVQEPEAAQSASEAVQEPELTETALTPAEPIVIASVMPEMPLPVTEPVTAPERLALADIDADRPIFASGDVVPLPHARPRLIVYPVRIPLPRARPAVEAEDEAPSGMISEVDIERMRPR